MLDMEQPTPELDSAAGNTANPDSGEVVETTDVIEGEELESQQPEPEEAEDEVDGVKLRGPKETLERLKNERLMQADYTRKTQEVADQRKAFEQERMQFQQTAQTHQAHLREVAQLMGIDERLAQFQNFNFDAAADQDPVQALKLHNEDTRLQAQRGQLANSITQKQQQQQMESQRTNAKQILEAREVLARDIKGWSPDLANKLSDYGKSQGYPPEVLDNVTKPEFVKTLHKAYLYDQLQKQRTAKPAAEPAKPATRLSGAGAVSKKPLSETSMEEYVRQRREYESRHR